MTATESVRRSPAAHPGPPLYAPAIAFVVTFVAGVVAGPIAGAGTVPSPYDSPASVTGWFAAHGEAAAITAWFQGVSALFLVIFAGLVVSRLQFLAPNAPGPMLAGAGALAAAVLLLSGVALTWAQSTDAVTGQGNLAAGLHQVDFALGGPLHTAALGVMVLGIAVTAWFLRRTPRWLAVLGVVLAVVDVLSTVSLLTESLTPLVPLGRFPSLVWLVAMSLLIPRERATRR